MAINKFKPHLHIIPEDDANRQIANGFLMHPEINQNQIRVLTPAGGWHKTIKSEDISKLAEFPKRYIILLIDFDDDFQSRIEHCRKEIGENSFDRVFILGSKDEPESLKRKFGKNYEEIGRLLAEDCTKHQELTWSHADLSHNTSERDRICTTLREIII